MELELADGGNLFDLLYHVEAFDERVVRSFFQQALNGLHWCHTNGVAHRDLKPDHILLDQHFFNLKMAGFGLASRNVRTVSPRNFFFYTCKSRSPMCFLRCCAWRQDDRCYPIRVSEKYMAPEVLALNQGSTYDGFKADVFSMGVILFIMLTQSMIYVGSP